MRAGRTRSLRLTRRGGRGPPPPWHMWTIRIIYKYIDETNSRWELCELAVFDELAEVGEARLLRLGHASNDDEQRVHLGNTTNELVYYRYRYRCDMQLTMAFWYCWVNPGTRPPPAARRGSFSIDADTDAIHSSLYWYTPTRAIALEAWFVYFRIVYYRYRGLRVNPNPPSPRARARRWRAACPPGIRTEERVYVKQLWTRQRFRFLQSRWARFPDRDFFGTFLARVDRDDDE